MSGLVICALITVLLAFGNLVWSTMIAFYFYWKMGMVLRGILLMSAQLLWNVFVLLVTLYILSILV